MEQVLYKLPDEWDWKTLGDICLKVTDGSHNPPNEVEVGLPMLSSRNVMDNGLVWNNFRLIPENAFESEHKRTRISEGDVLLTIVGTIGRSCVVRNLDKLFTLQRSVAVLSTEELIPEFLSYQLKAPFIQEHFISNAKGSAQKGIYLKQLKATNLVCPPIEEQKHIVEKIDSLLTRIDTAIEHLQESVTLADALYASSLEQVFEKVYLDYPTQPLSALASKIGSGATPKGGQKAYKESGISLIRSLNVYDSEFKPEGLAFIDDDQAEKLSNVVVEAGDVLLNITGASIARCCVAPDEYLPARVNQHVCIIRPKDALNSIYLNYLLISPKFKAALLFQGAGGATRQALTKVMVSNLEIPLPPPEMQAELVGKVNLLSKKNRALKEQVNSKISDLITLKASILDSAFKGEL
ncbi:restriction endonuclease subunit S [Aeromonas veronii]